ncbi:MAG: VWA domain-containing protein [Fimbriimonadaceae bacterium]|nr:VWA domain-containing protein [Chitinophagales bacterium]
MQFEHPIYLYVLCAIPVVLVFFFITLQWRKAAIKKIGDPALVKSLMERNSQLRKFIKLLFLILALTCFSFALANLRMGSKKEKAQKEGSEIIICFDVSRSMLAEDIKPDRLTRAQILVSQIIEALAGNKIGLVVFAGKAYVQMPLTVDARATLMYLNTINTSMVQTQGTNVGEAIQVAMEVFENGSSDNKKENKAIIIISDGESHDGVALEMAEKAATENIKLITIGVGTAQGAPIPTKRGGVTDFKKDKNGNIVLTKLNEQALQQIAEAGEGKYLNLNEGSNVLKHVKEAINSLEKDKGEMYEFTEYQNHFQLFLILGLCFLTIEFFMSDKRWLWIQKINVFETTKTK